ncbi:MAG: TlpA family protein disulfide reductase [Methyloceanibacter sp.]
MNKRKERAHAGSPAIYMIAALLAAIAGFGTVYWSFAPSDNGLRPKSESVAPGAGAAGGEEVVKTSPLNGLNKGAMAPFVVRPKPLDLPDFAFADGDGAAKRLADWRGKVVLLNIWATWCVPCREEMPLLNKLQSELGGKDFEVVAVNIDKGGPDKARTFLVETGAKDLALYTDPDSKLFATLKAVGMPTTLLLDREGREMGRLVGPADWAALEAKTLVEAAISASANSAASR